MKPEIKSKYKFNGINIIPPNILNVDKNDIFDVVISVAYKSIEIIKLPAKILPHKRNDKETKGAKEEIIFNGLIIIGIDFFLIDKLNVNFFK